MAQKDLTPAEREAELARREAVLAAREAQLAQEQAELADQRADFEQGKKSLLDNGDKNFVNPKEKLYDHFPLTVHQMDIIIGVLLPNASSLHTFAKVIAFHPQYDYTL